MGLSRLLALLLLSAVPAAAGTIEGQVEMLERGGRPARDLSGVVLYLDGGEAPVVPQRAEMRMKRKAFSPGLVVVPVGSTVSFPNDDPIFHNVFSPNRFDLELYKKPEAGSWTFEQAGVVKVYCNIHPQMRAVVMVRDNPFYTLADKAGRFRIEGVPAGAHRLVAWHERAREVSIELTVPESGSVSVKPALDASGFKLLRHKRKDGKPYSTPDY